MRDVTYADRLRFEAAHYDIRLVTDCKLAVYGRLERSEPFAWRLQFRHIAPYLRLRTEEAKRADAARLACKRAGW